MKCRMKYCAYIQVRISQSWLALALMVSCVFDPDKYIAVTVLSLLDTFRVAEFATLQLVQ